MFAVIFVGKLASVQQLWIRQKRAYERGLDAELEQFLGHGRSFFSLSCELEGESHLFINDAMRFNGNTWTKD